MKAFILTLFALNAEARTILCQDAACNPKTLCDAKWKINSAIKKIKNGAKNGVCFLAEGIVKAKLVAAEAKVAAVEAAKAAVEAAKAAAAKVIADEKARVDATAQVKHVEIVGKQATAMLTKLGGLKEQLSTVDGAQKATALEITTQTELLKEANGSLEELGNGQGDLGAGQDQMISMAQEAEKAQAAKAKRLEQQIRKLDGLIKAIKTTQITKFAKAITAAQDRQTAEAAAEQLRSDAVTALVTRKQAETSAALKQQGTMITVLLVVLIVVLLHLVGLVCKICCCAKDKVTSGREDETDLLNKDDTKEPHEIVGPGGVKSNDA